MINAEYGRAALVRFENHLDENPLNLDREDFGAPGRSFLTHLHNGHTAPESDGNPHYTMVSGPKRMGFMPETWFDNLYLNWPAGGDDREKQSFFWFHDHTMDHTGANVYKGMVGLYPIYDPKDGRTWETNRRVSACPASARTTRTGPSTSTTTFRWPSTTAASTTATRFIRTSTTGWGSPDRQNPATPRVVGKTFYKHFPNHGFVGDIFTVNGTAFPVLDVERRKYRFRFLDASVSRIYEFKLMSSTQARSRRRRSATR